MKISVVSFTEKGARLAERVFRTWEDASTEIVGKYADQNVADIKDWVRGQFEEKNALVFVGACGIAVRMIAPFVSDKTKDSPVLCMDEAGQFVIPILSGHLGGANELAEKIAGKTGAIPVVTTATDVNETFAVDMFAKRNHLTVQNKEGIARISAKVLKGEQVDIVISPDLTQLEHGILRLKPKEYVLGIGCRKGKSMEELGAFIHKHLLELGICEADIWAAASIDIKKTEPGLIRWTNAKRIPLLTYSAEELMEVEGDFTGSDFVREQTGVDNVCERAAIKAAAPDGELVLTKRAEDGMTLAIAKKKWIFDPDKQEGLIIDEE